MNLCKDCRWCVPKKTVYVDQIHENWSQGFCTERAHLSRVDGSPRKCAEIRDRFPVCPQWTERLK